MPERGERGGDPSKFDVALLFVLGLLIAPALFAGVILSLTVRQNEIANEERLRQAQGLLSFFVATNEYNAINNAYWNEAYRQVVLAQDGEWFQNNLGATQFGSMAHEAAVS